jgi:hypothetical protein
MKNTNHIPAQNRLTRKIKQYIKCRNYEDLIEIDPNMPNIAQEKLTKISKMVDIDINEVLKLINSDHATLTNKQVKTVASSLGYENIELEQVMQDVAKLSEEQVNIKLMEQIQSRYNKLSAQIEANTNSVINNNHFELGVCAGLTTLWAYAKRVENKTDLDPNQGKDDIKFLTKTMNTLKGWDGKDESFKKFSKEDKQDLDRFISNIILYQNSIDEHEALKEMHPDAFDQFRLEKMLEATKGDQKINKPSPVFSEIATVGEQALTKRLKDIIKPESMVFLMAYGDKEGHATSVYQSKDGQMYFYDPNQGETKVNNIEELTSKFLKATDLFDKDQIGLRHFRADIFKFDTDPSYTYPKVGKFQIPEQEFRTVVDKINNTNISDTYVIKHYLRDNTEHILNLLEDKNSQQSIINILKNKELTNGTFNLYTADQILSKVANTKDLAANLLNTYTQNPNNLKIEQQMLSNLIEKNLKNGNLDLVNEVYDTITTNRERFKKHFKDDELNKIDNKIKKAAILRQLSTEADLKIDKFIPDKNTPKTNQQSAINNNSKHEVASSQQIDIQEPRKSFIKIIDHSKDMAPRQKTLVKRKFEEVINDTKYEKSTEIKIEETKIEAKDTKPEAKPIIENKAKKSFVERLREQLKKMTSFKRFRR